MYWQISSDSSWNRTTKLYVQITGQPIRPVCASDCNYIHRGCVSPALGLFLCFLRRTRRAICQYIFFMALSTKFCRNSSCREEVNNEVYRCTIALEKSSASMWQCGSQFPGSPQRQLAVYLMSVVCGHPRNRTGRHHASVIPITVSHIPSIDIRPSVISSVSSFSFNFFRRS